MHTTLNSSFFCSFFMWKNRRILFWSTKLDWEWMKIFVGFCNYGYMMLKGKIHAKWCCIQFGAWCFLNSCIHSVSKVWTLEIILENWGLLIDGVIWYVIDVFEFTNLNYTKGILQIHKGGCSPLRVERETHINLILHYL